MIEYICTIPILKSLLSTCVTLGPLAVGYVEGEYVLVAPVETAIIKHLEVKRGDRFAANQPLALMEKRDVELAVRQAEASAASARSKLADLLEGKRPEEIAVIAADLNSAKVQVSDAKRVFARQRDLLKKGITSKAEYDAASTKLEIANAKVDELEASLVVAKLPARADQISAAKAVVNQSEAALGNANWRLEQRILTSPAPGVVSDIIRNPGEIAGPQAPVLSVLPDGAVKLRVYVSQKDLADLSLGSKLSVNCDGCGDNMSATISYIATDPEFTPPVIYSLENRQKLVYLIEARPDPSATALKPGQLVDVELSDQ